MSNNYPLGEWQFDWRNTPFLVVRDNLAEAVEGLLNGEFNLYTESHLVGMGIEATTLVVGTDTMSKMLDKVAQDLAQKHAHWSRFPRNHILL